MSQTTLSEWVAAVLHNAVAERAEVFAIAKPRPDRAG